MSSNINVENLISTKLSSNHVANIYLLNSGTVKKGFYRPLQADQEVPVYLVGGDNVGLVGNPHSLMVMEGRIVDLVGGCPGSSITNFGVKYERIFRDFSKLVQISIKKSSTDNNPNIYYVGKGIILDKNLDPLFMLTTILGNVILPPSGSYSASSRCRLSTDTIKAYIRKDVFSSKFATEQKKVYKQIVNVLLPEVVASNIPLIVNKCINMAVKAEVRTDMYPEDYSELLRDQLNSYDRESILKYR